MPLRILITGCNGQVGTEFCLIAKSLGEATMVDRDECDFANERAVRELVRGVAPNIIVNAAAYTAVDQAEKDRELCFALNATAPTLLAEEAAKLDAVLIHYSTDYVFDGAKSEPYVEVDPPSPLNVYGASKLAGEQGVLRAGGRSLVLRTSWVYSAHGRNFLLTILRLARERRQLKVVNDQIGAPTSAKSIAQATHRLLTALKDLPREQFPSGLYHMTAAGSTSWFGFATAILALASKDSAQPPAALVPIPGGEYPTAARRPRNSALSNEKFMRTFGFSLAPWQEQLNLVMAELAPAKPLVSQ